MASGPITSWQVEGENVKAAKAFLFLSSKVIVDGEYRLKIRRQLLLGRKAMTNLRQCLKSQDITLLTRVHMVKAMVFPVVMYSHESWTIKKAESLRIDLSNCGPGEDSWESLGLLILDLLGSNQSILKEINPEESLEGLMLKLKLQYLATCCEQPTHWKRPWCWERLKAKGEGDRGWDAWMASVMQWTWT